jgi:hypothetical protein
MKTFKNIQPMPNTETERTEAMSEYLKREFCQECGHTVPAHDIDCPLKYAQKLVA